MGIIYKITNPSNKVYIGQTIHTLEERIKGHKKSSTNCTLLKRAIDKYGDEMKYEKLEEVSDELLDEREIHWIKHYNSLAPNGYNCSAGGNNKKELSDLLKGNISKGMINYKINRDGYLGFAKKMKTGYVPVVKIKSKYMYLSQGAFNTEEEAIEVLKEYTIDPENFIKPDGTNKKREKRVGCVFKLYNKWKVMYKHKHLGTFITKEQAEEHLRIILNK
jgi:hypothetical protein